MKKNCKALDNLFMWDYNIMLKDKKERIGRKMTIDDLYAGVRCEECGKFHRMTVDKILIGKGVLNKLPELMRRYCVGKVFMLADKNTYRVAGERVESLLALRDIEIVKYIYEDDRVVPDEHSVGRAFMRIPNDCDIFIAVGSGVINDIGKLVGAVSGKKYMVIATAPSMDGYASALSSMERDGMKVSIPTGAPTAIIGDVDILKEAPEQMLRAGIGDMLAKYVSICEWRLGSLICGEYDCEAIADMVRDSLRRCVDNAEGLMARDDAAIAAVFEGLVIAGISMSCAGMSRPASGVEHYISHIWDMRGLEFGTPVDFHGIQCAIGTVIALRKYEELLRLPTPDMKAAREYAKGFDYGAWSEKLRGFLGNAAEAMIRLEKSEGKYDPDAHAGRLEIIMTYWDHIRRAIEDELPRASDVERLLGIIGAPRYPSDINIDEELVPMTLCATRDIRDKYTLSRLVWDLGLTERLFGEV